MYAYPSPAAKSSAIAGTSPGRNTKKASGTQVRIAPGITRAGAAPAH